MNPTDNPAGFEESDIVTPDDLEVLAMSNTTGCNFPPDTSDDDEQAGEAWD